MALTSDACHKGLPKSPTGEIPQFKGKPRPGACGGLALHPGRPASPLDVRVHMWSVTRQLWSARRVASCLLLASEA